MVTVPPLYILLVTQIIIGLAVLSGVLFWLWRRERRATPAAPPPPPEKESGNNAVANYLAQEIERTRTTRAAADRGLPEHVPERREHFLSAELEALAHIDHPDRLWSHLCDRLDTVPGEASAAVGGSTPADAGSSLDLACSDLRAVLEGGEDGEQLRSQLERVLERIETTRSASETETNDGTAATETLPKSAMDTLNHQQSLLRELGQQVQILTADPDEIGMLNEQIRRLEAVTDNLWKATASDAAAQSETNESPTP